MNKAIQPPPYHYSETLLYKKLKEKERVGEGLSEKVDLVIEYISPLLNNIGKNEFEDYTLHNSNHPIKLLHLAESIISVKTIESLSSLEICVLIFSFYLHDLGMFISTSERADLLSSDRFNRFLFENPELSTRIEKTDFLIKDDKRNASFKSLFRLELHQLQEIGLTNFLRINHADADTYRQKIKLLKEGLKRNDLFEFKGISYENELIDICVSHNEDPSVLLLTEGLYKERFRRDMYISGLRLNAQFCAGVLRIADVLDFDRERTPKSLFDALAIDRKRLPGYEISIKEWKKHLAVHTITINDTELIINAVSDNPNIEKAIREFSELIQKEVRETIAILSRNVNEITDLYSLSIPQFVRPIINSKGYVYKDFSIRLNQESIINLLMGESLYKSNNVAIRELVQNSIDACSVKSTIVNNYDPKIEISFEKSEDDLWLIVEDNGIGMDEHVISNFLLTAGESYYSSNEFRRQLDSVGSTFNSISRFGIGFLSVFIISDVIEITTSNKSSLRKDNLTRKVIIEGTTSLAIVQEFNSEFWGTKIRILLKKEEANSLPELIGFLRENVIRPSIPVMIKYPNGNIFKIGNNSYVNYSESGIRKTSRMPRLKFLKIDASKHSSILKGFLFVLLFKNENGLYTYYDESGEYRWDFEKLKLSNIFDKYTGNRVTVNGFLMSLKKIGNLLSAGGDKVFGAVDIDVIANSKIEYDVSRDRLIGKGLNIVRRELIDVLEKGLKAEGIYEHLDQSLLNFLTLRKKNFETTPPLDKNLLEKIKNKLPEDKWDEGFETQIAEDLGISITMVKKYILALLNMREAKKPKKKKFKNFF
jgi:molecular chaperone HtpG